MVPVCLFVWMSAGRPQSSEELAPAKAQLRDRWEIDPTALSKPKQTLLISPLTRLWESVSVGDYMIMGHCTVG